MLTICLMTMALGAEPELRPYHEIQRDLRGLLRKEAAPRSDQEHAELIWEMTRLYDELKRDPRQSQSDTLKSYRHQLWSRLTQTKKQLEAKFARQGKKSDAAAASAEVAQSPGAEALAENLDLVGHAIGGPLGLVSQARNREPRGAAGGGGVSDYGPLLVELIERTIAPDFWDVNGGPGSIVYFQPLHCLVVRASGEVHGDVGGLLGKLK